MSTSLNWNLWSLGTPDNKCHFHLERYYENLSQLKRERNQPVESCKQFTTNSFPVWFWTMCCSFKGSRNMKSWTIPESSLVIGILMLTTPHVGFFTVFSSLINFLRAVCVYIYRHTYIYTYIYMVMATHQFSGYMGSVFPYPSGCLSGYSVVCIFFCGMTYIDLSSYYTFCDDNQSIVARYRTIIRVS